MRGSLADGVDGAACLRRVENIIIQYIAAIQLFTSHLRTIDA